MILALDAIDPTLAFVLVLAAIIVWALAAFGVASRIGLIPLGLALAFVPVAWNYLAAA